MYEFYNRTRLKSPQYRFGKERRGYLKKNENPGPGQYHISCAKLILMIIQENKVILILCLDIFSVILLFIVNDFFIFI